MKRHSFIQRSAIGVPAAGIPCRTSEETTGENRNDTLQSVSVVSKLRQSIALCLLTVGFQLVTVSSFAQYAKLHDFAVQPDGVNPFNSLIAVGDFLYGTTALGGTSNVGTIFKIKPDGTGYTILFNFAVDANGRAPQGSLLSDGTFLYGMASNGSSNYAGTIFKIKPDGTNFTKLFEFDVTARNPIGSLISDGTFLYGMTQNGGINDHGIIFKIKPDGTAFTKLLDFDITNGRNPFGDLMFDGTFLYGMTQQGGLNNYGVIFKIKPDGTGYSKLLDFAVAENGRSPQGSLISDGTFLYGMTTFGGTNNFGTIFKIKPDGTGHSKLLDFAEVANGSIPQGSLISDGTFLYGMAYAGGLNGFGTIFKIKPDGTAYAKLLDFADLLNGSYPRGSLLSDGTSLYGTAWAGGFNGYGTIFKYGLTPTAVPTITNFAPISGPVGATVVITGTNFSATPADNTVRFNGTVATVTAATTTSITTTVPAGASTGTITVTVGGNPATSAGNFSVHLITGVEEDSFSLTLYPNPVKNELIIDASARPGAETLHVVIYDMMGRVLDRKLIKGAAADRTDTSQYQKGLYLVTIRAGAEKARSYKIEK